MTTSESKPDKFVFNPDGKKTIVSIDGGGMRGIIALAMLIYLEDKTGKPAYDLFDMVGGTSTGAIIGAGLGLGMTARQIMDDVYKGRLRKAFGPTSPIFFLQYLFTGLRHFYKVEPFIEAMGPLAVGKTIADIKKPIILFTTKDIRSSNTYYITNYGKGAAKFADWPLPGAVAASGAAPIFFPPILGNLIDGGVGAFGNPCLATSIEAVEYMDNMEEENILHVSLGTGFVSNEKGDGAGAKFWLKQWLEYMLLENIDDAALQQVYINRLMYKKMDFRRYNPSLRAEDVKEQLGIDAKGLNPETLSLDSREMDQLDLMEEIGYSYADKIDWLAPRTLPWDTIGGHKQPGYTPTEWKNTIFDIRDMMNKS